MHASIERPAGPKVSIIVAIYNVGVHLQQCVQSILSQSERDMEIILVNDGSTDASGEICDRFAREDSRVRVLHQSNAGVSVARNNGMALASGEWIMFVDGDDWMHPGGVETLLTAAAQEPDCELTVGTYYWSRDEWEAFSGETVPVGTKYLFDLPESRKGIIEHILGARSMPELAAIGCNLVSPWGKLYRRSFLEEKQLRFKPNQRKGQDFVFNLYVQQNASRLQIINAPIYHYRIWGGSISEQLTNNRVSPDMILVWAQEVDRFLCTCGYDEKIREFFAYNRVKEIAVIWIDRYKAKVAGWAEATAEIRKMKERGWHVALANPYYSWKDRIFAVLLKLRLYRLFWIIRCVYST